jgi:hypothetical protein
VRGWIEWFVNGLRKRRRPLLIATAWIATIALLISGWAWFALVRNPRPVRTMTDPTFERSANALCASRIPKLRAVRREGDTEKNLEQQTAKAVESAAGKLTALVSDLRGLSVEPRNASQVNAWFGHFDDYIAAGHHYAAALRTGNDDVFNRVDDEGIAPLKAISHFARANHIDACIP